jgi:hypothetical protein
MSWDIVVFKLNKNVGSVEEINENVLVEFPVNDFKKALIAHFSEVELDGSRAFITDDDYELECFIPEGETFSNTIFKLYGEQAVYALVDFCRKEDWQAYDTGLGEMLNLSHSDKNGYISFQTYLAQIVNKGG